MRAVFLIRGLLAFVAASVAGCQPGDPLERKVSAAKPSALAAWRAHIASDTSAEHRRRIEEALQEIRLKVTGDREIKRLSGDSAAAATESVDEAVCKKIHGRPVRELVQLGYELRVQRLKEELAGLEDAMKKNAQLVTRPGDLESKHHLEGLQARQKARVEKYRDDLAAAERELAPLLKTTGRPLLDASPDSPLEPPVRVDAKKA